MAGLAFFVAADGPPGLALLAVIASYTIAAPSRPALSAVVLVVAGEGHLAVANAVLSTIRQIMTFLGPLLGTVVVLWSPAAGFALNAATFAVSGLILATVSGIPRAPFAPSAPGTGSRRLGVVGSFADGLSAAATIPSMPALVSLIAVMYFVRGSEMVLHVFVVRDQLDADVGAIGLLGGAIGLGALLAMPIASRAASSDRPTRAILVSIAVHRTPDGGARADRADTVGVRRARSRRRRNGRLRSGDRRDAPARRSRRFTRPCLRCGQRRSERRQARRRARRRPPWWPQWGCRGRWWWLHSSW